MTRRPLGICLLALVSLPGNALFPHAAAATDKRPNIIYIMADDLGYGDLGCYGQKKILTPEIDALCARGLRFTQHYAGTSVCAPTRCSLMTGLHTGHSYVRANSPGYPGGQTPIPKGTETIGTMLQRAGYRTACIGKWGLGSAHDSGAANSQGFDDFFGYYDQRHAHEYYTDHLWRNDATVPLDGKTYSHDLMTAEALEFIEKNKRRPFFLYLPYCIPHTKFQVPELGVYADKPWTKSQKTQAAMITRMDRDVGALAAKLRELGIADKTLILFTSDHGAHGQGGTLKHFSASGPLRGKKRSAYEGGLRVPLVAFWPGTIAPGTTSDHISAFWDMMPTLADLSGGKPREEHDGISFVPTLLGQTSEQPQHESLYFELFERGAINRALRMGKWKAVVPNWKKDKLQLFDLETDLGETTDVSEQHPKIVASIRAKMDAAHTRSPIWNLESNGFNLRAACEASGVPVPKNKK
jgi:arylsulfatase A-like enzyme